MKPNQLFMWTCPHLSLSSAGQQHVRAGQTETVGFSNSQGQTKGADPFVFVVDFG